MTRRCGLPVSALEAARQAEALERDRANALEVRKLLQSYAATSEVLDDLLAQFVGVSNQRKALLDHIHELGFNMPSTEMDHSTGERAIKSALQLTPYRRAFESLRPAERKGFTADTAARVANVEQNRIIPLLGEQQISEPEAA